MADKFDRLVEIVRKLRKECPWDREQTHSSLRRCLLEETYEVLDALDVGDVEELKKELGDLLLQVVFHSIMAEENNEFSLEDVIDIEVEKLIRRHPHVFGDVKVSNSDEVKQNWEKHKIKEGRKSILEGIPIELPALFRAYRIQEKAAKVGFDWKQIEPVYEKILEEIEELKTNIQKYKTGDEVEEEFGDVLFALVNYARFLKINPEDALRKTINKFVHRFNKIEQYAQENNLNIADMPLEEMDVIWNKVKKQQ
ncbi:MAG: nucleoside triphosphate pyrophosphohydrolase [Ignavibacteria bacterium]